MHKINRRIRFQKIAPNPFACVRLARYQQHTKAVAHTVDLHHRGVVAVGQFAVCRRHGKLKHIHAAMWQSDGQFQIFAGWHGISLRCLVIYRDGYIHLARLARWHSALIFNAKGHLHFFAQNRKSRGIFDDQTPVPIGIIAGQQHMQRGGHIWGQVKIMHLPIGDHNRPRNARAGFVSQGFGQRGHS